MAAILEIEGLEVWYGLIKSLHGISLSDASGGATTVLGAEVVRTAGADRNRSGFRAPRAP